MAGAPDDNTSTPSLWVNWNLGSAAQCHATLAMYPGDFTIAGSLGLIQYEPMGYMDTWCDGDDNVVTLLGITVRILTEDPPRATFSANGTRYTATVPLSIFPKRMKEFFKDGGTLLSPYVNSFVNFPALSIGVDNSEQARSFTIGS